MALNVTRSTLRSRARRRADAVNSTFFTDAEVNDLINVYLSELYDILVDSGPPDYYSTDYSFSTVAGTTAYNLPADFYRSVRLYSSESGTLRAMRELTDVELHRYKAPQGAYSLVLRYVPAAPVFTADSGTGGTFDSVSSWDQLIVCWVARAMLQTEESDTSDISAEIQHLEERVRNAARKRSMSGPKYITDIDEIDSWRAWQQSVYGYKLRADKIDVYDSDIVYP